MNEREIQLAMVEALWTEARKTDELVWRQAVSTALVHVGYDRLQAEDIVNWAEECETTIGEAVRAYDERPAARLLDNPHYAERWTR